MTEITDAEVGALLTRLVEGQREALGEELIGSYVFGSAVTGDFDPGISDADTVAVLRSDPTDAQLESLEQLHRDIVQERPAWVDRVEAVYLSSRALRRFRAEPTAAARISPGEPFHAIEVDRGWLIDWYWLREAGVAWCGPPASSLVPVISHDEFVEAVRRHLLAWSTGEDGPATRAEQAYAVLTMCRGLRTVRTGEHVSKRRAAQWACEALPEHAALIREAVVWRERSRTDAPADGASTRSATARFIGDVQRLVAG